MKSFKVSREHRRYDYYSPYRFERVIASSRAVVMSMASRVNIARETRPRTIESRRISIGSVELTSRRDVERFQDRWPQGKNAVSLVARQPADPPDWKIACARVFPQRGHRRNREQVREREREGKIKVSSTFRPRRKKLFVFMDPAGRIDDRAIAKGVSLSFFARRCASAQDTCDVSRAQFPSVARIRVPLPTNGAPL